MFMVIALAIIFVLLSDIHIDNDLAYEQREEHEANRQRRHKEIIALSNKKKVKKSTRRRVAVDRYGNILGEEVTEDYMDDLELEDYDE